MPDCTEQWFIVVLIAALACSFTTSGSGGGEQQLRNGTLSGPLVEILSVCRVPVPPSPLAEGPIVSQVAYNGQVLTAVATLVAEVVNNHPQCLATVNRCGLGKALLDVLCPKAPVALEPMIFGSGGSGGSGGSSGRASWSR